jgi:hypothetical protein
MPNDDLLKYIKQADIFDLNKIELYAGLDQNSLSDAVEGIDAFTDRAAFKIAWLFQKLGINPVTPSNN